MLEKINDVIDYLSNIPSINYGGCLIAAYSLFLYCENNQLELPQIVCLNKELDEYKHISNKYFLTNCNSEINIPEHFGWKFKNSDVVDVNGPVHYDFVYELPIPIHLTKSYSTKLLKAEGWNEEFERGIWLPRIERDLKVNLNL